MKFTYGAAIVAVAAVLADCSAPAPAHAPAPVVQAVAPPLIVEPTIRPDPLTLPLTFAAVGDSITGWQPDNVHRSWIPYAGTPEFIHAGGWAESNRTTDWMLANSAPTGTNVVVIMGGTNDIHVGIPVEQSVANITVTAQIADADITVLSAIAPSDTLPAEAAAYNVQMHRLAISKGWLWVDPYFRIRTPDNRFVPGTSIDGGHPTVESQMAAAEKIRMVVLDYLPQYNRS